jgi:hypothetical protein
MMSASAVETVSESAVRRYPSLNERCVHALLAAPSHSRPERGGLHRAHGPQALERVFSGDSRRPERGRIDIGREIPAALIEAAGAQILEGEESRQPILIGRFPTSASARTATRGILGRKLFLGKPPFQGNPEECGELLQCIATGPVRTALQIPMNILLVVGPERARNADVSRAVDRCQIRPQEGELLTNGPVYLAIKLQVIEFGCRDRRRHAPSLDWTHREATR